MRLRRQRRQRPRRWRRRHVKRAKVIDIDAEIVHSTLGACAIVGARCRILRACVRAPHIHIHGRGEE